MLKNPPESAHWRAIKATMKKSAVVRNGALWTMNNIITYDGHLIFSQISYWETLDGSQIREMEGSADGSINGLDISEDGNYFVSGGNSRKVKVCLTKYLLSAYYIR